MARKETILTHFHEPRVSPGSIDEGPVASLQHFVEPTPRKVVPESKSESFDIRIKGKRSPKK